MATSDNDSLYGLIASFVVASTALVVAAVALGHTSALKRELERRIELQETQIQALSRRTLDSFDLSIRCCTR